METVQNEQAAKYLLGKLTDEEQAVVETLYFQNTASFENILIAENSLIDAYVSDRLVPEDRVLFERRLLISPRQRQRAAFAETFVNYASGLPFEELRSSPSDSRRPTIFARFFSFKPPLSYSLAAAAFLFLASGVIWWASSYSSGRPGKEDLAISETPSETLIIAPVPDRKTDQRTAVNEAETTPNTAKPLPEKRIVDRPKPPAVISTIILSLGSTRDSETGRVFVIPEETDLVNVKLKFDGGNFSSYFAIVETADGRQIWSGKVRGSTVNNNVTSASLTIPANRLSRGDYIVTLKGLTETGVYESVADYSFTVDRRP